MTRWWRGLLGAALLGWGVQGKLARSSPIPPPVNQQRADCDRPAYATDQLICSDSELHALDVKVEQRLETLGQRSLWPDTAWFENQQAWFKRRSLCAFEQDHRACAEAAYLTRLIELNAVLLPPPTLRSIRCGSAVPWRVSSIMKDRALFVSDTDGNTVLIAHPSTKAGWTAFVAYQIAGRHVTFHRYGDKKPLTCVMQKQGS